MAALPPDSAQSFTPGAEDNNLRVMLTSLFGLPGLLRAARRAANMTQADLAGRLRISQAAVAKLERPGANPTVDTLDRLLWATGHRLLLEADPHEPGVDESLIREQLELTPAQRIRGIETMYAHMHTLSEAGARTRDQPA
jgi:transcriptional regulator with XRE-family HTH domain